LLFRFAKFNKILLVLFFLSSSIVFSDDTFPYSFDLFQGFAGGKLFIFPIGGSFKSVFMKPTFGEFSESVFFWNGLRRDTAFGIPTVPPSIIFAKKYKNNLIFVSTEANRAFISLMDLSFKIVNVVEIPNDGGFYSFDKVNILCDTSKNKVILLINDYLYLVNIQNQKIYCELISKNVINACFVDKSPYELAFVRFEEGNGFAYLLDTLRKEKVLFRVDLSDEVSISQYFDKIVVVSSSKYYNSSLFQIATFSEGLVNKFWVETRLSRLSVYATKDGEKIYYLRNYGGGYLLVISFFKDFRAKFSENYVQLPSEFSEPYGTFLIGDKIYCLFRNGICLVDFEGNLVAKDFFTFGEYFPESIEIEKVNNFLVLSSKSYSLILEEKSHPFWLLSRFIKNFGKIIIPLILLLVIFYLSRRYFKQKRLLRALIEVPTTGVVFIVDKYGRLLTANNSGKDMLGITESVPMNKIFGYYCTREYLKMLNELVEKIIISRESFVQKITFVKNKTDYEWLFTLIPLKSFTGSFKGAVITGIDITEVLGRQKLSNLAQLAHDMQTNLSTIRLNAEQLEVDGNTKNDERRRKIIHQVGLLMQRVRDIVTVGRGELVRQNVDAYDLCHEARMEFDETMFPNVEFELNLQHFEINCDKPKMIRAIRNAIENAIKAFQGKPGKITISNWKDVRNAYFSIKDNGPGMDKTMLDKFLKPYFTTGGTGIGTMIIQHVIELHGGNLKVNSEKGKGTELLFVVPLPASTRKTKISQNSGKMN